MFFNKKPDLNIIVSKRSHQLFFKSMNKKFIYKNCIIIPFHSNLENFYKFILKILSYFLRIKIINMMSNYSLILKDAKNITIAWECGHLHDPPTEGVTKELWLKIENSHNMSDLIVYPTNAVKKEYETFNENYKNKKSIVLRNSFDEHLLQPLKKLDPEKTIDLMSIATCQRRKNWPEIFEILYLVDRRLKVIFVTDTNFEETFKKDISNLRAKHEIKIYQNLSANNLHSLLSNSKYYIQSTTYEGFCIPIFEAIAHGSTALIRSTEVLDEIYSDFAFIYENKIEIIDILNKNIFTLEKSKNIREKFCNFESYLDKLISL